MHHVALSIRRISRLALALGVAGLWLFCVPFAAAAAPLADPAVDAFNTRIGTQTFAGLYQFTTNTLLVETAQAIAGTGSGVIKFYLGQNTAFQSGVSLPPTVNSLVALARDEPSYHQVLDMPFQNFVLWAYPMSNPDAPFQDGNYSATERANDYREMHDLTSYLLTNYNNSGKTFYLGHWESDGYLDVNGWTTNPAPATLTAMIAWLDNRQQAVDDAKQAASFTNVNVFNYAEVNRVRDAMLNGPTNNVRAINAVIPYVTNLDCLSYSSYDAQDLGTADLHATLDYIHSLIPTNKNATLPGPRLWIGEYGHGELSTDAQETFNRAYIQRLLNWNSAGQTLPFILFWEIYDNEPGKNFCLIDSNQVKTASWYLHEHFINDAKLSVARFKETNGRLPADLEFSSLVTSLLNQQLPAPVSLVVANLGAAASANSSALVSGTVTQGIYGDEEAGVWLYYGRMDGGTAAAAWETNRFLGWNTRFNPATFTASLFNLAPRTNYFFRFLATNATATAWSPASGEFSTTSLTVSNGTGGTISLGWPESGADFALYTATSLTPPVAWMLVTNAPVWTNNQWRVTLARGAAASYFRLQGQ